MGVKFELEIPCDMFGLIRSVVSCCCRVSKTTNNIPNLEELLAVAPCPPFGRVDREFFRLGF